MIEFFLYMIFSISILFFIALIAFWITAENHEVCVSTENGILTAERAKKLKFSRR